MDFKFLRIDEAAYEEHRNDILEIFLDSGSSGVHQQYLDQSEESAYHDSILHKKNGYGFVALCANRCVGYLLAYPLIHEPLLPESIKESYPVEKCFYVAEMHMQPQFRGKKLGTEMMRRFIEDVDASNWEFLVIRAWKDNEGALRFYERFGFKRDEIIDEEKTKKDRSGTFWIQKQYMLRKLSDVTE